MNEDIFHSLGGSPKPPNLVGKYLCASELLVDPNFFRTVILLAQQDRHGALGVVLNRPDIGRLGELISSLKGTTLEKVPFSWGGPVGQDQLFLYRKEDPSIPEPFPGLRPLPGVVFEPLTQVFFDYFLENPLVKPQGFRIFAGYAGWESGQLEREADQGAWYWLEGDSETMFLPSGEDLYKTILSRKGPVYKILAQTGIRISEN